MSDCFLGEIRIFAGIRAPANWAFCDGRSLPIAGNEPLYSLIGTTYGGTSTTFCLPDLRSRLPIGQGNGVGLTPRTLAQTGGTETVTITEANLPVHNHGFQVSTLAAVSTDPTGAAYGTFPNSFPAVTGLYVSDLTKPGTVKQVFNDIFLENSGGNASHENRMPSFGLNFIMALLGTYPPRPN
jgi:microcystin-dependent protein